jgi:4-diphosphocytidyl-2-C-methyl-D-erythritol kinase
MTMTGTQAAPAKINLYLHVVGKRADGYHSLDSLVVFAGAADRLSARASDTLSLALTGPFGAGLREEPDNLVLRAARALAEAAGVPPAAHLKLEKNLPVASGIGGGSADAAAALRVLQQLWNVSLPAERLAPIALKLGADVPVCLASRPTRMGGVGEVLSAAPRLPSCGLVLVNPGVALPTVAVFRARQGGFTPVPDLPDAWADAAAMAACLAVTRNDLEPPAISLCPPIAEVLAALRATRGARLARMSGSGATCFALYDDEAQAKDAAAALARPGWWCWSGKLLEQ